MIKVRIQGTKKELKSFLKYLRNSPKWQKSFSTASLAVGFVQEGKRVLVIDNDSP